MILILKIFLFEWFWFKMNLFYDHYDFYQGENQNHIILSNIQISNVEYIGFS